MPKLLGKKHYKLWCVTWTQSRNVRHDIHLKIEQKQWFANKKEAIRKATSASENSTTLTTPTVKEVLVPKNDAVALATFLSRAEPYSIDVAAQAVKPMTAFDTMLAKRRPAVRRPK
ncbi:MAG: hypothetical protein CMF19_04465 [Idiomarinaceae bacterium]|nr:hypothetical protein [Idiomarinaceae bacterium]